MKERTRQRILTIACCSIVVGSLIYIFSDGAPLPMPTPYTISTGALVSDTNSPSPSSTRDEIPTTPTESVPPSESTLTSEATSDASSMQQAATDTSSTAASESPQMSTSGKVNINTASVATLDSLPGIGEVLAKRIVDYRNKNGAFSRIEDLMDVSGIGEKKFADMKDYVII